MDIHIHSFESAPDQHRMNDLLGAYYNDVLARLVKLGGPELNPAAPIADFWAHIDDFLPPKGRLMVAKDENDRWLGCGTLSRLPNKRGELKRLYVADAARGTGLGRRLVEERIAQARTMGITALMVDTFANTHEMQGLYASLGFRQIERYPESATANAFPQLEPYMRFFTIDL